MHKITKVKVDDALSSRFKGLQFLNRIHKRFDLRSLSPRQNNTRPFSPSSFQDGVDNKPKKHLSKSDDSAKFKVKRDSKLGSNRSIDDNSSEQYKNNDYYKLKIFKMGLALYKRNVQAN